MASALSAGIRAGDGISVEDVSVAGSAAAMVAALREDHEKRRFRSRLDNKVHTSGLGLLESPDLDFGFLDSGARSGFGVGPSISIDLLVWASWSSVGNGNGKGEDKDFLRSSCPMLMSDRDEIGSCLCLSKHV